MSLDTSTEASLNGSPAAESHLFEGQAALTASQWQKLERAILARAAKQPPHQVFGPPAADGSVYRWGVAASLGGPCGELVQMLSRLAVDAAPKKSRLATVDLPTSVEVFIDSVTGPAHHVRQSAMAVLWGAALPSLIGRIDLRLWWNLLSTLQQFRESTLQLGASSSPAHLIVGGELGLTLAWRLADLPSCKRLAKPASAELDSWFADEADSVSAAIASVADARLVLASVLRCQRLLKGTQKKKFSKRQQDIASDLAVWVAAFSLPEGLLAFSHARRQDLRDDTASHGLLRESAVFDPETLEPAVAAALGESRSGGRLAWEVSLPEAMQHDEDAKVAVLMPEWDVRRGRMHIDYSSEDTRLELFAGRHLAISGDWQVMISVDGEEQHADGDWIYTCEYTDDDVHYLELEQNWSGGVSLQRQFMLVREDRCALLADTVVLSDLAKQSPQPVSDAGSAGTSAKSSKSRKKTDREHVIRYTCRLPIAAGISVEEEAETREIFLGDTKRRAMVLPLSACEWRVGPTAATIRADSGALVLDSSAKHSVYAPLWFDFQPRRFKRPRTWRQLTVADELRVVGLDEAAGFRIQTGSEQWLVYRSLGNRRCRTVLGKHLIADFFSARFDPGDGSFDELVTVDDSESFDD